MALLREFARVVLREHVRDHAAEVPEEALALVHAADDAAGEDGQVRQQRIAGARLELLLKALGPVLRTDLVAVHKDAVQARLDVARERAEVPAELRDVGVEVEVHRGLR